MAQAKHGTDLSLILKLVENTFVDLNLNILWRWVFNSIYVFNIK